MNSFPFLSAAIISFLYLWELSDRWFILQIISAYLLAFCIFYALLHQNFYQSRNYLSCVIEFHISSVFLSWWECQYELPESEQTKEESKGLVKGWRNTPPVFPPVSGKALLISHCDSFPPSLSMASEFLPVLLHSSHSLPITWLPSWNLFYLFFYIRLQTCLWDFKS